MQLGSMVTLPRDIKIAHKVISTGRICRVVHNKFAYVIPMGVSPFEDGVNDHLNVYLTYEFGPYSLLDLTEVKCRKKISIK